MVRSTPECSSLAADEAWQTRAKAFFRDMPKQYVMDVSIDTPDAVLKHMELVEEVRVACRAGGMGPDADVQTGPVRFLIRRLEKSNDSGWDTENDMDANGSNGETNGSNGSNGGDVVMRKASTGSEDRTMNKSTFSSSPNLVALHDLHMSSKEDDVSSNEYEITVAAKDKERVLASILGRLAALDLNVLEAHAFCAQSGVALDVFVVSGWHGSTSELEVALVETDPDTLTPRSAAVRPQITQLGQVMSLKKKIEWRIDPIDLRMGKRFASGSYGDLHLGTYKGRTVAVKVIRAALTSAASMKEFDHEVSMMHQIQHPNIVEFVGSCTTPTDVMIVSEYMEGGNCYDYLRSVNSGIGLKVRSVLNYGKNVADALVYLHKKSIIHRDLKTANFLLNKDCTVLKIADFGVARLVSDSGDMTAETGTYRWMAPEVIEHQKYTVAADVFSFGICIWELLTAQVPYEKLSAIQSAMQVVEKDLRPKVPGKAGAELDALLKRCWEKDPKLRPPIEEVAQFFARQIEMREGNAHGNGAGMLGGWRIFGGPKKERKLPVK